MTTNTVSSSSAAAAVRAQQQSTAKHKPAVDFTKVLANAGGDIKTDINTTATKQAGAATAVVQNDGTKTTA